MSRKLKGSAVHFFRIADDVTSPMYNLNLQPDFECLHMKR